nr:hypothetical protein [uncultured Celeribacter sp.]
MTSPTPTSLSQTFQRLAVLICAGGLTILIAKILRETGGSLFYTLDDPYIHLALAENLLHGHYGINPGEVASPSSSILYPILLAVLGAGPYAPMVLNLIGALGSAYILSGLLWEAFGKDQTRLSPLLVLTMVALLAAANGYALALTGMEHTLHMLASLLILRGLTRLDRQSPPDILMILGLLTAPLLRFEGFALTLAALGALAIWGHWRSALAVGVALVAVVLGYIGVMQHLGLPPLPSSVLVKSSASAAAIDQSMASAIAEQFTKLTKSLDTLSARWLIGGMAMLCFAFIPPLDRRRVTVALVVGAAATAHILVGQWGWYGRYEVYIMATMAGAVLYVWTPILSAPKRALLKKAVVLGIALVAARIYVAPLLTTPMAARNVHDQQYQMHRFATEFFPETVAVNDLGWVAYRNEAYVLDLWGLGSEIARKNRSAYGLRADWIAEMAEDKNATYAMIYPGLFADHIPGTWCLMGVIRTPRVTSAYENVGFYLIDPARQSEMRAAFDSFAATLPPGTSSESVACAPKAYDWTRWAE